MYVPITLHVDIISLAIYIQIAVDHNRCYVRHLSKQVNISLTLFDTAGQERFDSVCTVSGYLHIPKQTI